jgi:multidrug efflux system outer membrane protein
VQGCVPLRKRRAAFQRSAAAREVSHRRWSQKLRAHRLAEYFKDPNLTSLISTALQNNQELNILMQEIAVSKAEVLGRKGAIFPFVSLGGNAGLDKVGKYTREGAVEENLEIKPERRFPDPSDEFRLQRRFRLGSGHLAQAAQRTRRLVKRYLTTQEGRNFMVTHLVAEIAETYYELLALDSQMAILKPMIEVQQSALRTVNLQKDAA